MITAALGNVGITEFGTVLFAYMCGSSSLGQSRLSDSSVQGAADDFLPYPAFTYSTSQGIGMDFFITLAFPKLFLCETQTQGSQCHLNGC